MKVATDIARLFGIAQIYLYSVQYITGQNDKKTTSEWFYQGFPTQKFLTEKKETRFSKPAYEIPKFRKIQKLKKK